MWVYEEADESGGPCNLYVHHDVLLPAFPLSLAWLDCSPTGRQEPGNLAAVGTMSPGIELWDLDVMDAVEPVATLGGELTSGSVVEGEDAVEGSSKDTKKKKKKAKVNSLSCLPRFLY